MNPLSSLHLALAATLVLGIVQIGLGADWHVATNGAATQPGTAEAPWDIASALAGRQRVAPGDTVWLHGGTYKRPFEVGGMGWPLHLAGQLGRPVQVRARPGERVTLDGGLNIQPPATHLWVWDLELTVSDPRPAKPVPPDSSYRNVNRPWGGLNVYSGEDCKFINCVIHDNSQGVSWWVASSNSELHGCILYDNGWAGTDRGHGHAIYTQNRDGVKTISDCLFTGGFGYTLHAYGSGRAFVDHYRVEGNVAYEAHTFLIGGGRPSQDIRVVTNLLHRVPLQLGYSAPTNHDCEVLGNLIVNADLTINRFGQIRQEGNRVLAKGASRPPGAEVWLRPNRYAPGRAHLAILNWDRREAVAVDFGSFLQRGDRVRLMNPRDFYGAPALTTVSDGGPIRVPTPDEFAAFVVLKETRP